MPEVIESWNLYKDLSLPLNAFINAICNDDLSGLIISGNPSQYHLELAWFDIQQKFTETIGGRESDVVKMDVIEYNILETREALGKMLLEVANVRMNDNIAKCMRLFEYPIPEHITEENRQRTLKTFANMLNSEGVTLDNLTAQFENKEIEYKKPSREDFIKLLTNMSLLFQMPPMNVNQLTTEQYCEYYRAYIEQIKAIEKQREELKRR